MKAEDLIVLNEEIAGMARAGLPLDQGLAAMAREMGRGTLRRVTAGLADDLRAGRTLPEALDRQAGSVPPFYAGLVLAGMRTGRISEVLATLTVYARSVSAVRAIVIDALFYPAVLICFQILLCGFLAFYVLPQFDAIFKSFGMKLPALTEFLLGLSRHALELVVIPLAVFLAGLLVLRFALQAGESGRRVWARMLYAVPIMGTLIRAARLAAFTELLAILIEHEVPLPEALRLAGEASSDPLMTSAARDIQQEVSQGMPLATALRGRGLTPAWVSWMAGTGERRGTLGQTLHHIADTYRRQVETRALLLRSVLPPFLIVCIAGGFVAFLVFALMLPLFKMLEGLSM